MYRLRTQKFQNTPRGPDGRAAAAEKRIRLDQANFEDDSVFGRASVLHPTKGWRSRNMEVLLRHGEFTRRLDENRPVAAPTKAKRIFVDDKIFGRREILISQNKYR